MNEQIRKIAKESGLSISQAYSPEFNKFAELIVRECANYAFSDEQEHKAMLKHFGVE